MTMPPAYEPYPTGQTGQPRPLNALAVVSLITSILPLYLVGVITGHVALSQIKRTSARGHGLAIAGLILGYIGLVLVPIIGILSAIAIPIFLGQQGAARDSAVQSDIVNAKVAVVSSVVIDPTRFPTLDDVSDVFVAGPDSVITLTGDVSAFCIEGYSLANEANSTNGATHYASSDLSNTVPGTCADGVLVPAP